MTKTTGTDTVGARCRVPREFGVAAPALIGSTIVALLTAGADAAASALPALA